MKSQPVHQSSCPPSSASVHHDKRDEYIPFTWHESRELDAASHLRSRRSGSNSEGEQERLRRQLHLVRQLQRDESSPPLPAWSGLHVGS